MKEIVYNGRRGVMYYIENIETPKKQSHFERIKAMSVEEMAKYFALDKHPSSPCYICEHDKGLFCTKEDCNSEYKIKVFKEWLESEVEEDEM